MSEETKVPWFERDGPYRLKLIQSNEFTIVGPEDGGSETPRRFPRKEAEAICYWMNGAYAFGRRASTEKSEHDRLRDAVIKAAEETFKYKRPGYHDCTDDGLPECEWCLLEKTLDALAAHEAKQGEGVGKKSCGFPERHNNPTFPDRCPDCGRENS